MEARERDAHDATPTVPTTATWSAWPVRPDGRPFLDMTYAYDAVGNVLSRTNAVPVATGSDFGGPSQQSFVYDDLDRMTSSQGSYQFAAQQDRALRPRPSTTTRSTT